MTIHDLLFMDIHFIANDPPKPTNPAPEQYMFASCGQAFKQDRVFHQIFMNVGNISDLNILTTNRKIVH